MNEQRIISQRARSIDASGIRKVFDLGASLKNPINLSIGQPDYPVDDAIKRAACDAINENRNGYTVTQGIEPLRTTISDHLKKEFGWDCSKESDTGLLVTSGTSGALILACLATMDADDREAVIDMALAEQAATATEEVDA